MKASKNGRERPRQEDIPTVKLTVRVQAGARRERILSFGEGILRVAVQAPPVEGAANRALIRLLARSFGISSSRIHLVRGEKSKTKALEITGVTPETLKRHLEKLTSRAQ